MKFLLLVSILYIASSTTNCTKASNYWSVVQPIVKAMNLDQKIGQMTQADAPQVMTNNTIDPSLISKYSLGSILVGGNAVPDGKGGVISDRFDIPGFLNGTLANWQDMSQRLNISTVVSGNYTIYPLLGTDAVHGNQHVVGSVLFPHNIGGASTHNATNFYNAGKATGISVKESLWNFAFAPTVAVSHNFYWGRHYETMGSEHENIRAYAGNYSAGIVQDDGNGTWNGALSSVKHFLGDGATYWGIDEGNDTVHNWNSFLEVNYQGYAGGKDACMGNVMVSYSAINDICMSINAPMLTGVLKEGLWDGVPFEGFLISDYDAIGKVSAQKWPSTDFGMSTSYSIINIINAGMDMAMLASTNSGLTPEVFIETTKQAVMDGSITMDRIDDAVTRILGVKCIMGLIEGVEGCATLTPDSGYDQAQAREDALFAAKQSLVLLKNDKTTIPANMSSLKYIVLTGERDINQKYKDGEFLVTTYCDYDNIGAQCGGWTVAWQGYEGNEFWQGDNKVSSGAMTILDSILQRAPNATIYHNTYRNVTDRDDVDSVREVQIENITALTDMDATNTLIIGVISENPYAEWMGDINNPFCQDPNAYDEYGCMYINSWLNPYLPDTQPNNITLGYQQNSIEVINATRSHDADIPLITVQFSGRPTLMQETLANSTAFIQAWLPGTTGGEAIVSAITGEYKFKSAKADQGWPNTLAVDWLSDEADLHNYPVYWANGTMPAIPNPLFTKGYGISTAVNQTEELPAFLNA